MDVQNRDWLLRIEGEVLGPYNTFEVEALIHKHQISEVDEAAMPCRGWRYVRDYQEFKEAFDIVSKTFKGSEKSGGTLTGTAKLTESGIERTEDAVSVRGQTQTKEVIDLGFGGNLQHQTSKSQKQSFRAEPTARDFRPAQSARRKRIGIKTILLMVGVLGFVGYKYMGQSTDLFTLPFQNKLEDEFLINWSSGDLIDAYMNLKSKNSLKSKYSIPYISLVQAVDGNIRLMDDLLAKESNKISDEWKNLKGLSELYKNNLDRAESYFLSILKGKKIFIPAFINLGILKKKSSKWNEARFYFDAAYSSVDVGSQDESQDRVSFYLSEAWALDSLKTSGVQELTSLESFIKNQLVSVNTYEHELRFLLAWVVSFKEGFGSKELEDILEPLIYLDPNIILERKQNPYVYKELQGEFAYICNDLEPKLRQLKNRATLLSLCHYIDGDSEKAESYFGTKDLSDVELAFLSFLNKVNGNEIEASENLIKSLEQPTGLGVVKFYLQARFCEAEEDLKCAAEFWNKALKIMPDSYVAHTGLARAYFKFGDIQRAEPYLKRARGDYYTPLLELRQRMKDKKKS